MPKTENVVCKHIKQVKSSLENAEASFRDNNGLRGELDLMLAEAEMKHLREKRGFKSYWNRQMLAALIALILVLTGAGGWFWARATLPEQTEGLLGSTIDLTTKKIPTEPQMPVVYNNKVLSEPEQPKGELLPAETAPVAAAIQNNNTQAELERQTQVFLPQEDIRNLVRAARKTLNDTN